MKIGTKPFFLLRRKKYVVKPKSEVTAVEDVAWNLKGINIKDV